MELEIPNHFSFKNIHKLGIQVKTFGENTYLAQPDIDFDRFVHIIKGFYSFPRFSTVDDYTSLLFVDSHENPKIFAKTRPNSYVYDKQFSKRDSNHALSIGHEISLSQKIDKALQPNEIKKIIREYDFNEISFCRLFGGVISKQGKYKFYPFQQMQTLSFSDYFSIGSKLSAALETYGINSDMSRVNIAKKVTNGTITKDLILYDVELYSYDQLIDIT